MLRNLQLFAWAKAFRPASSASWVAWSMMPVSIGAGYDAIAEALKQILMA